MRGIAAVALGIACLVVFGAAAGTVDAPRGDVTETYDVAVDAGALLTVSGGEAGGQRVSAFDVYGLEVRFGGPLGGTTGLWLLGLVGLWVLVVVRSMDVSTAVAVVVLVAVLVAAMLFVDVNSGGAPTGTVVESGELGLLDKIALLLLGSVTMLSGVFLLLPDDAAGYTADLTLPFTFPAAISWLGRRVRGLSGARDDGGAPDPDNEVYKAWARIDRRYGAPERTPGEVVERASASGAPEDAMQDLRRVFEEVRYGDKPPDEDRVRRAREVGRRALHEGDPDGEDDEADTSNGLDSGSGSETRKGEPGGDGT